MSRNTPSGTPSVSVRCIDPSEWAFYRAIRLQALGDAPDAFGSTLIAEAARPDVLWQDRLAAAASSGQDLPLFAVAGDAPAGLAWAKVDAAHPTIVHLFQMWVHPAHRGAGIGRALLDAAVAWARARGARCLSLGVTIADSPAYRLYLRAGFVPQGDAEPLRDGSELMARNLRLDLTACAAAVGAPPRSAVGSGPDTPGPGWESVAEWNRCSRM